MKILECQTCGLESKVSQDVISFLCHYCVAEMTVATDLPLTKKRVGYPKGWKFMNQFVHADGTVYHKGVEQPELKNTLPPTAIVEKPKISKKQKEQEKMSLIEEYAALKKKLKAEKRKTARKKIEARLNKLTKLI